MSGEGCVRCAHARETGWIGPGTRSHCKDCHRDWNGLREAHCPTCCAHFSTPGNFDLHLTAHGCQHPGLVVASKGAHAGEPKLALGESKHGPIWRAAGEAWAPDAEPSFDAVSEEAS